MKSLTICLTTQEVEQRFAKLGIRCSFSDEERMVFSTTPRIAVPGPAFAFPIPADNQHLNLDDIKTCVGTDPRHQPSFFDHPWYAQEDFMRLPCAPGWHVIQMDVLEGSIQQTSNYLDSSRSQLVLPSAVEVVLMLFLHYAGTGEQLLLKKHTWCSDLASLGRRVTVGAFGRNGVFISSHPPNFVSRGLGICGKIDLSGG